ncbi:hypothetical protein A2U01_0054296, partial [Trifolium medium]|nr:hypothetical protein [Trifolium medium]
MRRRDPHEDPSKRKTKTTYTCTTCGGEKHNALSCTSLEVNPEAQKRKRKPKKNAIVAPQPSPNATAAPQQDPNATDAPHHDPNTTAAPPEVPIVDDDV